MIISSQRSNYYVLNIKHWPLLYNNTYIVAKNNNLTQQVKGQEPN